MLKVINATKKYDDVYGIREVSFKIEQSEIVGLIGENGAGKTTLLKCIAKSLQLDDGEILIEGTDIHSGDDLLRNVGIMINAIVYPHLTVYDNLRLFSKVHGYETCNDEVYEMIEYVDLTAKTYHKSSSLSFGMKQKLALCLCLISKPKLLILDEPFVGLDQKGVNDLRNLLIKLQKNNTAIIVSSHRHEEVRSLCNRILQLKDGKVVYDGNVYRDEMKVIHLDATYKGGESNLQNFKGSKEIYTRTKGRELHSLLQMLMKENNIVDISIEKETFQ